MPKVPEDELVKLDTAYAIACVEHALLRRLANEASQRVVDTLRALNEAKARNGDDAKYRFGDK